MAIPEESRLCAVADAAICSWDNKYAYNHWRPLTSIRQADLDGNGDTQADPTWAPLVVTPPFPSYTSGHSTFSSASATILAAFFGTDNISFTTTSDGLPGVTRSFPSLSAAAAEAGQSRIYGGIHWQYDNQDGLATGAALANHLLDNFFSLTGDLNHDDLVNHSDLVIMLEALGGCPSSACLADLNHDGFVNGKDIAILMSHFSAL